MARNVIARDFSLANPDEEDFDIFINQTTGDFHISNDSNQEHVDSLFRAFKGEYRINPNLGIGIAKSINGKANRIETTRRIKEGMLLDSFDVTDLEISITPDGINIRTNANRLK